MWFVGMSIADQITQQLSIEDTYVIQSSLAQLMIPGRNSGVKVEPLEGCDAWYSFKKG